LIGTGWLFWYPVARPVFGFVVYYVVPMLLIGVLYGRVVRTLLTTAPQCHRSGDRDQLRRKQAARSFALLDRKCPAEYIGARILKISDAVMTKKLGAYFLLGQSVWLTVAVTVNV